MVTGLEQELGVKLLKRTRSVKDTEIGRRYCEDGRRVLAALAIVDEAALGVNAEPWGRIPITAL